MKIGLDTSVVVRLLTGDPPDLALAALNYLVECNNTGRRIILSDLVLAESYYALQYHYRVPKKEALRALRDFLASPGVETIGEVQPILSVRGLESAKPGFVDQLIHRGYIDAGAAQFATFEKAAKRLPATIVLPPRPTPG